MRLAGQEGKSKLVDTPMVCLTLLIEPNIDHTANILRVLGNKIEVIVNLCENCEAVLWHQKAISWLSLGCPFITYATWLLLGHLSKKNLDLKQQMILTKATWSLRHNSHALSSACVQCAVMHH